MNSTSAMRMDHLQYFNRSWGLEQILLFIKIVTLTSKKGKEITMGSITLQHELRVGRVATKKALKHFINLGLITSIQTAKHQYKKYTVNVNAFQSQIREIYDVSWMKDVDERHFKLEFLRRDLREKLSYAEKRKTDSILIIPEFKLSDAEDSSEEITLKNFKMTERSM